MRRAIPILFTLFVAGCGNASWAPEGTAQAQTGIEANGNPPLAPAPSNEYGNGTRLRARVLRTIGSDGSHGRTLVGWYDGQRKEECEFTPASDGTTRCMPTVIDYAEGYRDASCTAPYVRIAKGATLPKYVELETLPVPTADPSKPIGAMSETSPRRIAPIGTEIPEPTTTYGHEDGKCVKRAVYDDGDAIEPWGTTYTVGAEIPPAEFVAGTVETINE